MPASLPALAACIAEPDLLGLFCHSQALELLQEPIVPAYRVPIRSQAATRACRLADAVALLAERLDRLPLAYRHWPRHSFDPSAYFDLHPSQARALIQAERLGATLDITLHADLLSPAFRSAERFWAQQFCPAYMAAWGQRGGPFHTHLHDRMLPAIRRRLENARQEISAAGEVLFQRGDLTFLAAVAATEERARYLPTLPPDDLDLALLFLELPSLTLSRSFDLLEMRA